jgi:hypothetical protein
MNKSEIAERLHKMHVENHPCDCDDNECHGHTVHHLLCSCGFKDTALDYGSIPEMVLQHCPDFDSYKQAVKDTQWPI